MALALVAVVVVVAHRLVATSAGGHPSGQPRHQHLASRASTGHNGQRVDGRTTSTRRTTGAAAPTTAHPPSPPVWRVAWGSAMALGNGVASDTTVRELTTVGTAGERARVRVTNYFGDRSMEIGAATIGVSAGGPAVQGGTLRPLTFGGRLGVTVPAGHYLYSDPVTMAVHDGETLAISVFVSGTELVSVHPCCTTAKAVSYFTPNGGGDLTASVSGSGLSLASPFPRWVDAVDVLQTTGKGSIVVLGDSITDGYNSTLSWATVLQERIDKLPAPEQRAVVNEGITANALTSDVPTDDHAGGGPSGLSRLARDALEQPGVSEVVIFLGTNDLFFGDTAKELITGYHQAIAAVHATGLRAVAVTLLPRSPGTWAWSAAQQDEMQEVNHWIRASGAFAGVLDLASAVSDIYNGACDPTTMFPPYDSGDHLHPNAAGQTAMADAVDGPVLGLPPLPKVPPLVRVTPTPGCAAA